MKAMQPHDAHTYMSQTHMYVDDTSDPSVAIQILGEIRTHAHTHARAHTQALVATHGRALVLHVPNGDPCSGRISVNMSTQLYIERAMIWTEPRCGA
jgi:hypothetical protein